MAELNWSLLDTSAPERIATSFQRGLDWRNQNAMRDIARQQAQQEIQSRNAFAQALQSGAGMDALFAASPEQAYQYSNAQAQMQNALTAQENAMRKRQDAEAKRQQKEREKSGELLMFKTMFPGVEFQAQDVGDEYDIIPASYTESQNVEVSEKVPKQTPQFSINEDAAKRFGFTPEDLGYVAGLYQLDPKAAIAEMRELRKAARIGRAGARDVIAKEKAIAQAMGMDVGEYLKQKLSKSGGQTINVSPVINMAKEAGETAGKKEGMEIGEAAAAIENKYSAIDSVREAKDMLKQGIYSGYWGDLRKTVAKASVGAIGDRQKAARTEQFMSYIGNTVVPRLKEFGGNDSNEEMKYLQKIMGGDTSMEPEAIAAILDSAERKIQRGIERLQRQRGALEQGQMPDLGPGPSRAKPKARPPIDSLWGK